MQSLGEPEPLTDRALQQISHRIGQRLIDPRHECFQKRKPRFQQVFTTAPPDEPGTRRYRLFPGGRPRVCNAPALLCKALHPVKSLNISQPPRRAWAVARFAPYSPFAQKRDARPVGGRGISDYSSGFFSAAPFLLTFRPSHTNYTAIVNAFKAQGGVQLAFATT